MLIFVNNLKKFFLSHLFYRALGVAIAGCGLFLLIALLSYHQDDASFNRVSHGITQNWMGPAGANIADPILQLLGISAFLLAIGLIPLGYHMVIRQSRLLASLRLPALFLGSIICAAAFAPLSSFEMWDLMGMGGFTGAQLYHLLANYIPVSVLLPCVAALGGSLLFLGSSLRFASLKLLLIPPIFLWRFISWSFAKWQSRSKASYVAATLDDLDDDTEFVGDESDDDNAPHLITPPVQARHHETSIEIPEKKEVPTKSSLFKDKQRSKTHSPQEEFNFAEYHYTLPSLTLLVPVPKKKKQPQHQESALEQNAKLLENVLEDFGISGKITKVRPGPVVTLYELEPAAGTKSSRVIGLADDIARSMSAISARIAVIPGRNAIGIELPNQHRETVYLTEILESNAYHINGISLPLALGKDIGGESIVADLAKMPHLLVAGTTGSGKSVAVNAMILSLLYQHTPERCRFIMIDPKMLELSIYDGIPHLLSPVVTEPAKAVVALKWAVREMENRYRLMSNLGVRNVHGYNEKIKEALAAGQTLERTVQTGFDPETGTPIIERVPLAMNTLPYIVVVVDEMADLMLVAGKDIEGSIQRLAQMARAAGIHLIMATQRPSVDVITGVIKANFPTRISFQVTSRIDSRTILGEQGAEQLLGMGDMLYMSGGGQIKRVHGPFVNDQEVERVVNFLKEQGAPEYVEDVTAEEDEMHAIGSEGSEGSSLYDQAVAIVLRDKKASTSYLQRQLKIGYNRAADLIDQMEKEGVISPANHVGKREVLAG